MLSPTLTVAVATVGTATSSACGIIATALFADSGLDPVVSALYGLSIFIALGVILLVRATFKAVVKPIQEQMPLILNQATLNWLDRLRMRVGLPPLRQKTDEELTEAYGGDIDDEFE